MDAPRSPPDPATIVVALDGPPSPADIRWLCERVRYLVETHPAGIVLCDVGAIVEPDAGTIEVLARLQLTAKRLGGTLRLRHAGEELDELLSLAGLRDVLPCDQT